MREIRHDLLMGDDLATVLGKAKKADSEAGWMLDV
jgi:hypothetical protein